MSVLMEFSVVVIYLVVGWFTEEAPVTQSGAGVANRPWKGNLFPGGGTQGNGWGGSGGRNRVYGIDGRGGLVHMAVGAAREGLDGRQGGGRRGDGGV